jgi:hypothetical protein
MLKDVFGTHLQQSNVFGLVDRDNLGIHSLVADNPTIVGGRPFLNYLCVVVPHNLSFLALTVDYRFHLTQVVNDVARRQHPGLSMLPLTRD